MNRAALEVELQGTRLRARLVERVTERGLSPVVADERDVDLDLVRALVDDVVRVLNRGTRWGEVDLGSAALLRRKGATLFDALLPGRIKAALRAMSAGPDGPELALSAPSGLGRIPWELLHTGFGFLGLTLAMGRVDLADGVTPTRTERPRRMLVVADPRGDLIGSYYEGLTLRDELGGDARRLRVDLRSSEVGRGDVLELLRDYDVVHYAGHAEPTSPGGPRGWWLRDGVLAPEAIVDLGGGARFPRLVFINACRSARAERDAAKADTTLAEAFRQAGADHVIGTLWDVPDEPASAFAIQFHAALIAGVSVGEAARRARLAVASRYGPSSIYWAAWSVLGQPGTALFEAERSVGDELGAASPEPATLPALAARVRGVAVAEASQIASLDERRHARWLATARWIGAATCVAALVTLVGAVGARRADDGVWARSVPEAGFGPVERLGVAPLGEPIGLPDRGSIAAHDVALELGVVRADESRPTLAPGGRYRVRWSAPDDGWVTVWRVDARGAARHLGPVLASAFAGTVVDMPGGGAWYTRDGDGAERFLVAWRRDAPADAGELVDELRAMATQGQGVGAFDALREGLEDRFDRVVVVEVPRVDGATGAVFR